MKKNISILMLLVIFSSFGYASDNMIFFRKNPTYQANWDIGLINGATMTSQFLLRNCGNVVTDKNGAPIIKKGDFNGDGKDELLIAYNEPYPGTNRTRLSFYNIDLVNDTLQLFSQLTSYPYANISYINSFLFVTVGKYKYDDPKDYVNIIYANTDGHHETSITVSLSGIIAGPYHLTNDWDYGNIYFANAGNFSNSGKDELNIIYKNCSTSHFPGYYSSMTYDVSNFTKTGGEYPLTNSAMGAVKFATVGDYEGTGQDELNIIYSGGTRTGSNYYSLTYNPIGCANWPSVPVWRNPGGEYQLTNSYDIGNISFAKSGNFNGNGHEDLIYAYTNPLNNYDYVLCYNPIGTTFPTIVDRYQITNYTGKIRTFSVGDFDGDGKTDYTFTFDLSGGNSKGYTYSKLPNSGWYQVRTFNQGGWDPFSFSFNVGSTFPIGIIANYVSRISDKGWKAIPDSSTAMASGDFNIGWFTGLHYITDPSDSKLMTAAQPYIFGAKKTGNAHFLSLSQPYCIDPVGTSYPADRDRGISNLSSVNKKTIIQTFTYYAELPGTTTALSQRMPVFSNCSDVINTYNSGKSSVAGYYISDDTYEVINKGKGYEDPDNHYYTANELIQFNTDLTSMTPHKLSIIGDNFNGLSWAYDNCKYSNGAPAFEIPLIYEYYFLKDSLFGTSRNSFYMLDIVSKLEKLRALTLKNGQHGYLYAAQGHAQDNLNVSKDGLGQRTPSLFESRYDVFNCIIHGAGGVFYWAMEYSDSTVFENMYNISKEVFNYSSNENYSLLKALKNGALTDSNFCSKDGYNSDFDKKYNNPNNYNIPEFTGRPISDINYILRQADGTYYLITINNSANTISNVTYYLKSNIGSTANVSSLSNTAGWIASSVNINTESRRGINYSAIKIDSYDPFQVKIIRIGYEPLKKTENDFNQSEKTNVISDYKLSCYPNPFNPNTKLNYSIPKQTKVSVFVFNTLGQKVATLVDEIQTAGIHEINFNASNLSAGIYFVTLSTSDFSQTQKIVLLK